MQNVARFMTITGFAQAIANLIPELILKKSNIAIILNISMYCGPKD